MIKFQVKLDIGHDKNALTSAVEKYVGKENKWWIEKKSIDAREKNSIKYVYSISVELSDTNVESRLLKKYSGKITKEDRCEYLFSPCGKLPLSERPVVVGTGPAGMFASYMLSLNGYAPLVIERGNNVDEREKKISLFWETGELDPESNVQFGEGGAGTFSDGKLNTGVKDKFGRIRFVLETFVKFGAPEEILYANKPHIGTDILKVVMKRMREESIKNGAEFSFDTKLTDIIFDDNSGAVTSVRLKKKHGEEYTVPANVVILAIGHSARDTFKMLSEKKLLLERKAFAIGLRIEHLQEMIGRSQYGDAFNKLPAADYKMTGTAKDKRGVYSFCMCPGGHVVNASSEEGRTVVNGMSYSGRNARNANSAIVVQVNPEDFDKEGFTGVLSGMEFQRKWEELCFRKAGGKVPVQRFIDLKNRVKTTSFGSVIPDTKGRFEMSELSEVLPEYVINGITEGVDDFDRRLKGFADPDAVLSGVETRTSSPVRIVRNEEFEALPGLYPCGEGAGYAGGIMSAAVDGIKVFEAVGRKYKGF